MQSIHTHIYVLAYREREKRGRAYRIESLHFLLLFLLSGKTQSTRRKYYEREREREREREKTREPFEITKRSLKVK